MWGGRGGGPLSSKYNKTSSLALTRSYVGESGEKEEEVVVVVGGLKTQLH